MFAYGEERVILLVNLKKSGGQDILTVAIEPLFGPDTNLTTPRDRLDREIQTHCPGILAVCRTIA